MPGGGEGILVDTLGCAKPQRYGNAREGGVLGELCLVAFAPKEGESSRVQRTLAKLLQGWRVGGGG